MSGSSPLTKPSQDPNDRGHALLEAREPLLVDAVHLREGAAGLDPRFAVAATSAVGELTLPDGPTSFTMWREPGAGR